MAGHFEEAGEAIRGAVAEWQPAAAQDWRDIVPETSWGMQPAAWEEMLSEIADAFGRKIAPNRIRRGETFEGSWKRPLSELQRRLSDSVV